MLGPNIYGTNLCRSSNTTVAGALINESSGALKLQVQTGTISPNPIDLIGGGTNKPADVFSFDASRTTSVYTDSGKVYPLSLALNFIIKT